jgi:hypothetical protein
MLGVRPLTGHGVAVGVALYDARARQRNQSLQNADWIVADCDQVAQHDEAVDAAPTGDIVKHRVECNRIAVQIRKQRQTHVVFGNGSRPGELRLSRWACVRSDESAFVPGRCRFVSSSCRSRISHRAGQHVRRQFDRGLSRGIIGMQIQPRRYRRAGVARNGRDRGHRYACLDQHGAEVVSESVQGTRQTGLFTDAGKGSIEVARLEAGTSCSR